MSGLPAIVLAVVLGIVVFEFAIGIADLVALLKGCFYLRRLARSTPRYDGNILLKSPLVPPVSVIVTFADAAPQSCEMAQKLVELHYSKSELVVVLDGLDEDDLDTWKNQFRLCRSARGSIEDLPAGRIRGIYESRDPLRLVVVDKERGGFADALNTGVNVAASPVIGLLDSECLFEPVILLSLIRPMLDDPGRTIAICGVMPPPAQAQANASWPARFGQLETLRLWLSRCAAAAARNCLVPVPGTSILVLRDAIVKTGGFRAGAVQMFVQLHGHARASGKQFRVALVPEDSSYALPPDSLFAVQCQVRREQRELSGIWRYRKSVAGGIGAIGWALPGMICRRVRPILETLAYVLALVGLVMGWVQPAAVGLVLLSTVGLGILVSMSAVVFRELSEFSASDPPHLASLFFSTIPENLGYRQLRNLWLIGAWFRPASREP